MMTEMCIEFKSGIIKVCFIGTEVSVLDLRKKAQWSFTIKVLKEQIKWSHQIKKLASWASSGENCISNDHFKILKSILKSVNCILWQCLSVIPLAIWGEVKEYFTEHDHFGSRTCTTNPNQTGGYTIYNSYKRKEVNANIR